MRNLLLASFLLFLGVIFAAICGAAVSLTPNNFKYSIDMEGPIKSNSIYQVQLSSGILQKSAAGLNDIRVFDLNNNEIPYVIIENEYPDEVIETYSLEIVDYFEDKNFALITIKLPEKHQPISLIDLDIVNRDFKKNFILYGSSDMKNWDLLAEETIYDFSSQVDLRKTRIKFKKSGYRFYRIKLTDAGVKTGTDKSIKLKYEGLDFSVNNIKDKSLHINRIIGITASREDKIRVYDEKMFTDFSLNLNKDRDSVITIEADLPFDKMHFDISNAYYYREVELYFSETGKEDSYSLITRSPIYNFSLFGLNETKNYIENKQGKHKYYRIVVKNKNNPPLEVKSIRFEWLQKNLYFVALTDSGKYLLCFGNNIINRPDYDLSNFINQHNWFKQKHEKLKINQIKLNADFRQELSKDKKGQIEKIILTAIVIILVIGISFWLYKLIGKTADNKKT